MPINREQQVELGNLTSSSIIVENLFLVDTTRLRKGKEKSIIYDSYGEVVALRVWEWSSRDMMFDFEPDDGHTFLWPH